MNAVTLGLVLGIFIGIDELLAKPKENSKAIFVSVAVLAILIRSRGKGFIHVLVSSLVTFLFYFISMQSKDVSLLKAQCCTLMDWMVTKLEQAADTDEVFV